ncbi:MAG: sugar transporter [Gammaproteobacteria bacterium]|jgi:Na+/melibiose symporter-like transporter|nr:sugar transporter [Gammaproteobacteria bacterium]|tara:strand:+ start:2838 stop:4253 length:1416 start_codon:yes stop_codon:yes gene_type:complete
MPQHRVSWFTKVAYGIGSVAYGVKNNGFDYFFLIFYSQVMGVDAGLVSLALLIALMFDAVSDPLVGYFSDNTHSRWGRRHPFMYLAAVPVAISYGLIWNPPASLEGNELFPYLVVLAVFVRTLITLYEVPSSALVAEMTEDYDERTSMLSYRYFFGWTGGTLMAAFALAYLLVPTETISNGMFNVDGFSAMGTIAGAVIFVAIMASALGTHSYIPHLKKPPAKRTMTLRRIYSELWETLANKSFAALFLAALFGAIATGMGAGLNYYINSFYWEFTTDQISVLSISVVVSAVLGFLLSPLASRLLGKKKGAIVVGVLAFTVAPLPVALRLFGLMPDNGDPVLFPLILVVTVVDVALIIVFQTLMSSMIADLVEDSERQTSRRSEGVFFAAVTFTRKMVQGLGVVAAGAVLTFAQFPRGVMPGEVADAAVLRLGAFYAPSLFVLWMVMIACLSLYGIDRTRHEENLKALGRA